MRENRWKRQQTVNNEQEGGGSSGSSKFNFNLVSPSEQVVSKNRTHKSKTWIQKLQLRSWKQETEQYFGKMDKYIETIKMMH